MVLYRKGEVLTIRTLIRFPGFIPEILLTIIANGNFSFVAQIAFIELAWATFVTFVQFGFIFCK